jgi:hypothetical protein
VLLAMKGVPRTSNVLQDPGGRWVWICEHRAFCEA